MPFNKENLKQIIHAHYMQLKHYHGIHDILQFIPYFKRPNKKPLPPFFLTYARTFNSLNLECFFLLLFLEQDVSKKANFT